MGQNQGILTGMFFDRSSAESAVERLLKLGYTPEQIGVVINDDTLAREFTETTGTKAAPESTVHAGHAAIGGGLGLIIAGLFAAGSAASIAGVSAVAGPLVGGPLTGLLTGFGVIGAASGIIGALVGAGVPTQQAHQYHEGLSRGGILLAVHTRGESDERARGILASKSTASPKTFA